MKISFLVAFLAILQTLTLVAQQNFGVVSGIIIDLGTSQPLEFATIVITDKTNPSKTLGTMTNSKGEFEFTNLPIGRYVLTYSFLGFKKNDTSPFEISSTHPKTNLGQLIISESNQNINEVEVSAKKSTFVNSIDRKTFNVGEDLMSKAGSVSDLLQNVPSIQVDIDGNINLRGSDNVIVLINGKPSAMMGANRAAVLQQMPAASIDKIEVITNPSAKYKPDGTSGIINIVLNKNSTLGLNGIVTANAGSNNRYNGSTLINYNPGKLNVFGGISIRLDDRSRYASLHRIKYFESVVDSFTITDQKSYDSSRPLSKIVNAGWDYKLNDNNKIGLAGRCNYRSFTRNEIYENNETDNLLTPIINYNRIRTDFEYEKDLEFTSYFHHAFKKEGHELNADFSTSKTNEQEDNHYVNTILYPNEPNSLDNTLIRQGDSQTQASLEYSNPISEDQSFEAGYDFENQMNDMDFFGEGFNPSNSQWEKDIEKTNRFVATQNIHVLYTTYEQKLGDFGFLAGLRAEETDINMNQKTIQKTMNTSYFRFYPSLHLSYDFNDNLEMQLNYSHRIRRPEGDDLNPFAEYQDPYNIRVGNPNLKPTDIHSLETGFQVKKNKTIFISTLYYRYSYNEFTEIKRFLNDSVVVRTKENLDKSNSAGLELILSTSFGKIATFNMGTNTYYQTIDASNLGYSQNKSTISWSANLSAGFNIAKHSVLQITSVYKSVNLTPQGEQSPSFVMNCGFKQEVLKKKGAFIFTVSDLFNTMRQNSIIDTPLLYEKSERKRSARIIYAGFTYAFGNSKSKNKEIVIKYDNQL